MPTLATRRASGFSYTLADSAAHLDPAAWDRLTRDAGFFMSRRYLGVLESAGPANLAPRAALVYRDGRAVAALACQLVSVKGARVLVAGNLASWGRHGAAFAPGLDPDELWPAAAEALRRLRRAEGLPTALVLIKDLRAGDAEALRRCGYAPIATDPNMVLELRPEWRTFGGYLAAMQSKYRSQVNAVSRKLEAAGCEAFVIEDAAVEAGTLHALYKQVRDAAGLRPIELPPSYWPALAEAAGADLRLTGLRRQGRLLGFAATVKDGDTAVAYYLGYERALKDELPLYFRLLHASVQTAFDWGCGRVDFGRTCLDPKAQLGARPEPTVVWAREPNGLVNRLLRPLYRAVPHEDAPERDPFKSPA